MRPYLLNYNMKEIETGEEDDYEYLYNIAKRIHDKMTLDSNSRKLHTKAKQDGIATPAWGGKGRGKGKGGRGRRTKR